jgi:hypothetical protein
MRGPAERRSASVRAAPGHDGIWHSYFQTEGLLSVVGDLI